MGVFSYKTYCNIVADHTVCHSRIGRTKSSGSCTKSSIPLHLRFQSVNSDGIAYFQLELHKIQRSILSHIHLGNMIVLNDDVAGVAEIFSNLNGGSVFHDNKISRLCKCIRIRSGKKILNVNRLVYHHIFLYADKSTVIYKSSVEGGKVLFVK